MCARFPAPNAPPTDLVVFNETITSMNARWNPAPGRVQNYRITYVPTAGGRSQTVSLISDKHVIPTTHTVFIYKALSYLVQVISEHQNVDWSFNKISTIPLKVEFNPYGKSSREGT